MYLLKKSRIVINRETWCFQYTVGKTHKISQTIYWYYQNLNCKHYATFVYDQSTFDSFKYTSIGISKIKRFSELCEPEEFSVKQYVIKLDLSGVDMSRKFDATLGHDTFILSVDDRVKLELGLIDN
jgi:hypothetical protein